MPRKITVRKATHKWFAPSGSPAIAVGQLRGDTLYMNLIACDGSVAEKTWAVGSCAMHLTGYGGGVNASDTRRVADMKAAWAYTFGPDAPTPAFCEPHA